MELEEPEIIEVKFSFAAGEIAEEVAGIIGEDIHKVATVRYTVVEIRATRAAEAAGTDFKNSKGFDVNFILAIVVAKPMDSIDVRLVIRQEYSILFPIKNFGATVK